MIPTDAPDANELRSLTRMEQQSLLMNYIQYAHGRTEDEKTFYLQTMEHTLNALNLDNVPATMIMIMDIGERVLLKKPQLDRLNLNRMEAGNEL